MVAIFRGGRALRHPRTGASLGRLEETVGLALVEHVFETYATGRVIQGTGDVWTGDGARMRVRGGKVQLTVVPLVEAMNDTPAEAAVRELVEVLDNTRQFQISMGDQVAAALRQEGLQHQDILAGRGFAGPARRDPRPCPRLPPARSHPGPPGGRTPPGPPPRPRSRGRPPRPDSGGRG